MKTWLVMKNQYVDFDIRIQTPVAAGSEESVKAEVAKRNASLTDKEKKEEVSYCMMWVKALT